MNKCIYPFNLPIYESYILDQEFDIIRKEVFNYLKNNKSNFSHSWDCPTLSDINSSDRDISNNKYIKNIILSHAKEYYKEWSFKPFELTISELWVNVAPQGAFQEIHSHENMFRKHLFSGSLYLQTFKNSGNIVLYNPLRTFIPNMLPFKDDISYDRKLIESINKKIILFPSWMEHRVQSNNNQQNRVSLSWNISPIIK